MGNINYYTMCMQVEKQKASFVITAAFFYGFLGCVCGINRGDQLYQFYSISLGFVNKQFMDTIAICIACGINVVLNILLIPRYGIIGAAGATCLGFLVQLIVVFISAKLVTQLYTNFKFLSKVLTISLAMGFSIYFIRERVAMGNVSQLIILSLSGVIIYFLLALSMGLVRTEEIKRMFYKTSNWQNTRSNMCSMKQLFTDAWRSSIDSKHYFTYIMKWYTDKNILL